MPITPYPIGSEETAIRRSLFLWIAAGGAMEPWLVVVIIPAIVIALDAYLTIVQVRREEGRGRDEERR
jgi:hypothetical protein